MSAHVSCSHAISWAPLLSTPRICHRVPQLQAPTGERRRAQAHCWPHWLTLAKAEGETTGRSPHKKLARRSSFLRLGKAPAAPQRAGIELSAGAQAAKGQGHRSADVGSSSSNWHAVTAALMAASAAAFRVAQHRQLVDLEQQQQQQQQQRRRRRRQRRRQQQRQARLLTEDVVAEVEGHQVAQAGHVGRQLVYRRVQAAAGRAQGAGLRACNISQHNLCSRICPAPAAAWAARNQDCGPSDCM